MPAVNFVHKYESVFNLKYVYLFNTTTVFLTKSRSSTFMAQIDTLANNCGYTNYSATHVTYPPKGLIPLPGKSTEGDRGCRVWDSIFEAALLVNPAFDIYRIFDTVRTMS